MPLLPVVSAIKLELYFLAIVKIVFTLGRSHYLVAVIIYLSSVFGPKILTSAKTQHFEVHTLEIFTQ